MLVSLVIPCHDERDALPALFAELRRFPELIRPHIPEIVLIDDGSTDDTAERLYDFAAACFWPCKVLGLKPNGGIGNAIWESSWMVQGDVVITYDADLPYPLDDCRRLLDAIDAGADVATASPYAKGGGTSDLPAGRLLLSRGASLIYRLRLFGRGRDIDTFTCGFRAWKREAFLACLPSEDRFAATAEMLLSALKQKRRAVQIPSQLRGREHGHSKMQVWPTMRRHLRLMTLGPRTRPPRPRTIPHRER